MRGGKMVSSGSEPLEDGVRGWVGRQVTVQAYLMQQGLAPPPGWCWNLRQPAHQTHSCPLRESSSPGSGGCNTETHTQTRINYT